MRGTQDNRAGLLLRAYPDCAAAGHQREGIVSNNLRRPFDAERNGGRGVSAQSAVFVGYAHNYPSAVRAIGHQSRVIGSHEELLVNALSGIFLLDDLVAAQISLDGEIARGNTLQLKAEWRMRQIAELGAIGVGFGDQLFADVELDVVAVGAHYRVGERIGEVAPCRPDEAGFQHNFFTRITLRCVKAGRGLGQTEDVAHTVEADAVAGTEVVMRVVVEGTPSDAARILRIRSQLIVYSRMPQRVLGQAFGVVVWFGNEGMPDELCVQIAWMIRRPQRKTEVVHGEHIFQPLGIILVPYASGRAGGIQLLGQAISAGIEVVIILRFVHAYAPKHNRGMVPIAANHATDVVHRQILPGLVADVLPAGNLFQHQEAHFIASIKKVWRLRIVRGANDIHLQLILENMSVAPLDPCRHRLAHKRKRLVMVQPAEFDHFPVQLKPVIGELRLPETDAALDFVQSDFALLDARDHRVQVRSGRLPTLNGAEVGKR